MLQRVPFVDRLRRYVDAIEGPPEIIVEGKLIRMVGLTMEAVGLKIPVGGRCSVEVVGQESIEAEVVAFSENKTYLMPLENVTGMQAGARVLPTQGKARAPGGKALLGRVLNGRGLPIDGKGPLNAETFVPLTPKVLNPLERNPINSPLDVGVASINALLSVGVGQRLGLFAGSGVGKSVLLGMMTKFTSADVIVVGLIGERGREVKEFIESTLGPEGLSRAVVVACPADDSPLMRLQGAMLATAISESFRDQGRNVLLLMDSLTRFAQAQREIALAIGEPPATKGYPPSVFAKLPQLVERAGNRAAGKGSITAIYTVLTEGDDLQDPVADSARAILDGHIVLSRQLAEEGHFPAVDVEASISRVMPSVVDEDHLAYATLFRQLYSRYQQNRDLISVGAYSRGNDPEIDLAIDKMPEIRQFLQQKTNQQCSWDESLHGLKALFPMPQNVDS
ncbi:MAG: flagellum-specific ATP synthase FliI [Gammaproteobacteria bacterium]|nr:MAG: flagellum-specific ATP synthase FliI [Gammaproteobacteria bacterium]